MNRIKYLLFPAVFIAAYAFLHQFVFLHADDFYYGLVSRGSFSDFIAFQIDHYQRLNGRAIVHVLITAILIFDLTLWRLINPLMLFGTIYFAAKCAGLALGIDSRGDRKQFQLLLISMAALFLCFPIAITRETVFWLSGAFNYLYPMLLFFAAYYIFAKSLAQNKKTPILPLLTFLAAATMEQIGLMFMVALFLCFGGHVIRKRKINWVHILSLLTAIAGILTVLYAPGVQRRRGHEGLPLNFETLGNALRFFFLSPVSRLFIILFALGVIALALYLLCKKDRTKHWRHIADGDILISLTAFCGAAMAGQAVLAVTTISYNRMLFGSLFALLPAIVILGFTVVKHMVFEQQVFNRIKKYAIAAVFVGVCVLGLYQFGTTLYGYMQNRPTQIHRIETAVYVREHGAQIPEEDFFPPLPDNTFSFEAQDRSTTSWYAMFYMEYYRIDEPIDFIILADSQDSRLFLNGEQIPSPNILIRRDGVLYVQARRLVDYINATGTGEPIELEWDGVYRAVRYTQGETLLFSHPRTADRIHLWGESDQEVLLSAAIQTITGRTYLPIEVLEQGFGLSFIREANDLGGYDVWVWVD